MRLIWQHVLISGDADKCFGGTRRLGSGTPEWEQLRGLITRCDAHFNSMFTSTVCVSSCFKLMWSTA